MAEGLELFRGQFEVHSGEDLFIDCLSRREVEKGQYTNNADILFIDGGW